MTFEALLSQFEPSAVNRGIRCNIGIVLVKHSSHPQREKIIIVVYINSNMSDSLPFLPEALQI